MSGSKQRLHLNKRPTRILLLVTFVTLLLIVAYVYIPRSSSAGCFFFSTSSCGVTFFQNALSSSPSRELKDAEVASEAVIREILRTPPVQSKNHKIAFMFLTPGSLPFEKLWDRFFYVRIRTVLSYVLVGSLDIYSQASISKDLI